MKYPSYLLLLSVLLLLSACSKAPEPYQWNIPDGFPQPTVPTDNPMTKAKVELGEKLFHDHRLSGNQQQACATCHQADYAFAEPKTVSIGSTGQVLKRNASALVNVAYNGDFTWAHNGLATLEAQIMIPLFNQRPVEMGVTGYEQEILTRLQVDYQALFDDAFGSQELNFDRIVKALASFVRSLTSFDSAFDRYAYGMQDDALSAEQLRGMELFFSEKFECFHCHGGFNFTQSSQHAFQNLDLQPFHNTGLYNLDADGRYANHDQGLADVTLRHTDIGKFRAPTLRNVALTAPYMHDGSVDSLQEVIDIYAAGGRGDGVNNINKSVFVKGFSATEQEKADLLAFLHALTDQQYSGELSKR